MRISFVSMFYPSDAGTPDEHVRRFPLLRCLPPALAERGHEVEHVLLFPREATVGRGGVTYRFVQSPRSVRLAAKAMSALTRRPQSLFEIAPALSALIARQHPDIVHVFGTQLHVGVGHLRRRIAEARLVLHYHGGYPPRLWAARLLQRHNFAASDAVLFTDRSQAEPFVSAGVMGDSAKAFELVETSSPFRRKESARRLVGRPAFLSTCRLVPIKDPVTTLKGFERVLDIYPEAHLHHFYLSDELLPELRRYLRSRPALRHRVNFHGARAHEEMEAVYSGADVLLQSSLREFSGCAVLDAMACGVVPVVSDIPPHRRIAGDAGGLFKPGDPEALAACVSEMGDVTSRRDAVLDRFKNELSFSAMAAHLETIYRRVLETAHA